MADRDRRIGLNDPSIGPLPRTELLTELLIDERRNVLFVGEGDFSFTVAFAALRESKRSTASVHSNIGTWDGIIATRYEPAGGKPAPVLRHELPERPQRPNGSLHHGQARCVKYLCHFKLCTTF